MPLIEAAFERARVAAVTAQNANEREHPGMVYDRALIEAYLSDADVRAALVSAGLKTNYWGGKGSPMKDDNIHRLPTADAPPFVGSYNDGLCAGLRRASEIARIAAREAQDGLRSECKALFDVAQAIEQEVSRVRV